MLALNSSRWDTFKYGRKVACLLASLQQNPIHPENNAGGNDWIELYFAFESLSRDGIRAAIPHVLAMAGTQGIETHPFFLTFFAEVGKPSTAEISSTDDLADDFKHAMAQAARIAFDAVRDPTCPPKEFIARLYSAGALLGRSGIVKMFGNIGDTSLGGMPYETGWNCPTCQAFIHATVTADALSMCCHDGHAYPTTPNTFGVPNNSPVAGWTDPPVDDFAWAAGLALLTNHHDDLAAIRFLFGSAACPKCGAHFSIPEAKSVS